MSITKRRLGLAVLLAGASLLSFGQEAVEVPKHVLMARAFLANTAPEDNHYVDRGAMYAKAPGDLFSSKYVVHTDCKGFAFEIIRHTYDFGPSFSGRSLGNGQSSIVDWVTGAEKGEVFDQVRRIQDLKVGDYAMWSHAALADNARGHIVLIDRPPRKLERSGVEGLDKWEIYVIDSTGHAHSTDDTRYVKGVSGHQGEGYGAEGKAPNGVGSGRMFLYADADGNVKAVSNGFNNSTLHYDWHAVMGRVRVPVVAPAR